MAAEAAPTPKKISLDDVDWAQWFAKHGRLISIVSGVVVALGLGVWWYTVSSARKESFASQALDQARGSAEAGNLPLAASDLNHVITDFSGTKAADEAAILLAQVRLLQGQPDIAVRGLQTFLSSSHPDYVEGAAYNLLGAGLEQEGKPKDAGEAYRHAAEKARLDFLKATYLIDASRALAASGDSAGARAALAEVLDKYGRLDQAQEARVRMAELGGTVPPPPKDTLAIQ